MEKQSCPITHLEKPVIEMTDDELHDLLDNHWYPDANNKLTNQRRIMDASYLAYKSIMTYDEINRKRRSNGYGLSVYVPRTFATIEGVRKNFNINQLGFDLENQPGVDVIQKYKIRQFVNYDFNRSGTKKQIKDAMFDKLVYGNGFLYSFLIDRKSQDTFVKGKINNKTGRVEIGVGKEDKSRYYGMVARRISPYAIFPDPNGTHFDVDNHIDRMCNYCCIRTVKHIADFKRDWKGIIPKELLSKVQPGGKDMNNYEAVKDTFDYIFNAEMIGDQRSVGRVISKSGISSSYNNAEFVEERLWLGEDFLILQAGAGLPFLMVSCNPNPEKRYAIEKLNDVEIPGEFWAMGEPYLLRYQQIEENRVHNSVLDLVQFNVSQMLGVNAQYLEDPEDLDLYPGKVWKFKALPGIKISDAIQSFQTSPAAIVPALRFMQEVKQIGQQTTSITDFVMGASKAITETATESNKLANASDLTIVDKIRETVSGPMTNIIKNWFAQYPVVYKGEKIEMANNGQMIYFTGKTKESISEKELTNIMNKGYEAEDIIFSDDLDISNPKFKIVGDIEISKDVRLRQWTSAIEFSNNINKIAYETGDPRRIDTVQMGMDAMSNFDVISDPKQYLMVGQETKTDQMEKMAITGATANAIQQQNGGRPAEEGVTPMPTETQQMRSDAQPAKK